MDVLQRQVDEYEDEIRILKDFKSPKRGGTGRTPRRSPLPPTETSTRGGRGATATENDSPTSVSALEAAIFRPALNKALQDASYWKAAYTGSLLKDLAPLPLLPGYPSRDEESKATDVDDAHSSLIQLSSALSHYRLSQASARIVDLTNKSKTARTQLGEQRAERREAIARLENIILRCRGRDYM
jgi:hypothetical protein